MPVTLFGWVWWTRADLPMRLRGNPAYVPLDQKNASECLALYPPQEVGRGSGSVALVEDRRGPHQADQATGRVPRGAARRPAQEGTLLVLMKPIRELASSRCTELELAAELLFPFLPR